MPYPRVGHTEIYDALNDRIVVFGGGGNDTWELPLSGPRQGIWAVLETHGPHPSTHMYDQLRTDSAIYDPIGQRMIVLMNPTPATGFTDDDVKLWQLTLSGAPVWSKLEIAGENPGSEIQSGKLVYDASNQRALVLGGRTSKSGLWSLSLGETPAWTRLAGPPSDVEYEVFYTEHSLLLDATHQRVLLFGGHSSAGQIWAFSFDTATWTLLDSGNYTSGAYGATSAVDEEGDRIVIAGGVQNGALTLFSLSGGGWSTVDLPPGAPQTHGASVAVDSQRRKLVYFGGSSEDYVLQNETWVLDLNDLSWSRIGGVSTPIDPSSGQHTHVYDPVRNKVMSFGGYMGGVTLEHGLTPGDTWTPRSASGTTPSTSWGSVIYDPIAEEVITFGGYAYKESSEVYRLSSTANSSWEKLATSGPKERSSHLAVYDDARARMVIYGGWMDSSYPPAIYLDDVWALSLGETPTWTQIHPSGQGPGKRMGQTGIYDPIHDQMLSLGGSNGFTTWVVPELWALSLGDSPTWTQLQPSGKAPSGLSNDAAVYDPEGKRMIVLDASDHGVRVFALSLEGEMAWHELCPDTISPAPASSSPLRWANAVVVPDGLFVDLNGATFRFDLSTGYCP